MTVYFFTLPKRGGAVSEETEAPLAIPPPVEGKIIGRWFGDGCTATIYRVSGKLFIEEQWGSGGAVTRHEFVESQSPLGRRFTSESWMGKGGFVIDTRGNLHAMSDYGVTYSTLKRIQ